MGRKLPSTCGQAAYFSIIQNVNLYTEIPDFILICVYERDLFSIGYSLLAQAR